MRKIRPFYLFSALFLGMMLSACSSENDIPFEGGFRAPNASSSKDQTVVFEYKPAPGQFINESKECSSLEEANAFALDRLKTGAYVSLGGFGGYIVVGFDHSISKGYGYDFYVKGNSFSGSSEPGIVYVMQDLNSNGLPDDIWYELKGSDYGKNDTMKDYEVTYNKPADKSNITWSDNKNNKGFIEYLPQFHPQRTYYPSWITAENYTLKGVQLANNISLDTPPGYYELLSSDWGYVDNFGTDYDETLRANGFKISNAVDNNGKSVTLKHIDFIKVQCAINARAGILGEVSTEVVGFFDANL